MPRESQAAKTMKGLLTSFSTCAWLAVWRGARLSAAFLSGASFCLSGSSCSPVLSPV